MRLLLLGSNIARYFSEKGHDVICVARQASDIRLLRNMNVRLISNEPGQMELTFKSTQIDWVINGVCTYKPNHSLYGDMLESNFIFPLRDLNLAIKYGVRNYMTMGTGLPDQEDCGRNQVYR